MTDPVNHPPHYYADNGMEAIDVVESFFHDNCFLGNVFKYIARAGKKSDSPVEDLKKARFYLDREIRRGIAAQNKADNDLITQRIKDLQSVPPFTAPHYRPPTKEEWDEWDRQTGFYKSVDE